MSLMNLTSNEASDSSKTSLFSMEISLGEKDVEAIANKVAELIELKLFANTNIEDELLTVEEAAVLLKRTRVTIYQLVNNSKHGLSTFPYLKQGKRLRFSKNALLKWGSEQKRAGLGEPNRKKSVRRGQHRNNIIDFFERRQGVIPEGRYSFALIK